MNGMTDYMGRQRSNAVGQRKAGVSGIPHINWANRNDQVTSNYGESPQYRGFLYQGIPAPPMNNATPSGVTQMQSMVSPPPTQQVSEAAFQRQLNGRLQKRQEQNRRFRTGALR